MLPNKSNIQGSAQAWRKAVESGEVWNDDDSKQEDNTIDLRDIFCPECQTHHRTEEMGLKAKTSFSNLTCKKKECRKVTSSATWRCRCRRLWIKYSLHVHSNLRKVAKTQKGKKQQSRRARLRATMGVDAPMPKKRRSSTVFECNSTNGADRMGGKHNSLMQPTGTLSGIRLRPDTRLAEKFPHLVQVAGST